MVRIQLRSSAAPLFGVNGDEMRNEFVMRLQPGEGSVLVTGLFGGSLSFGKHNSIAEHAWSVHDNYCWQFIH